MNISSEIQKHNLPILTLHALAQIGFGGLFAYCALYNFTDFSNIRRSFALYSVLAVVCFSYSLLSLIHIIGRLYIKNYKKTLAIYGISEDSADADCNNALFLHNVLFGKSNMVYTGLNPFLMPYDNIIWCFISIKRNSKAVLPSYCVMVYDDKGNCRKMHTKIKLHAQDLLFQIKDAAPHAFFGKTNDLCTMYACSFDEMVTAVQKKKSL